MFWPPMLFLQYFSDMQVGFCTLTYIPKTKMHIFLGPKGAGEQPAQGEHLQTRLSRDEVIAIRLMKPEYLQLLKESSTQSCATGFKKCDGCSTAGVSEPWWSNSSSHILNGKREKNGFLSGGFDTKGLLVAVSVFINNPPWWMVLFFLISEVYEVYWPNDALKYDSNLQLMKNLATNWQEQHS